MFIGIAIAVGALAGLIALGVFIAKGGGRLTWLWLALLASAVIVAMQFWSIAGIYFHMPFGWILALVSAVLVVVALFVLVGKSLAWHRLRVVATVGLVFLTFVLSTVALIALPVGELYEPIFEARGGQIAKDAGFDALYPEGYQLKLDYLPIDAIRIDGSVEGLIAQYEGFNVQERKAADDVSIAYFKGLLASGEDPLGYGGAIPADVTTEELSVEGEPAFGIEYVLGASGKPGSESDPSGKQSTTRLLGFSTGGVEVLIFSEGRMEYRGGTRENERHEWVEPMSFDELVAVAESLRPLE
ncbi:MAG: hypothetical protein EG823_02405 [Actinobacteria bacterium]|nr:hypothetical protein [Actinomycetota bacterium]